MYYRNDPSEYSLSSTHCGDGLYTTAYGLALVGLLLECSHFLYGCPVHTKVQPYEAHTRVHYAGF